MKNWRRAGKSAKITDVNWCFFDFFRHISKIFTDVHFVNFAIGDSLLLVARSKM